MVSEIWLIIAANFSQKTISLLGWFSACWANNQISASYTCACRCR